VLTPTSGGGAIELAGGASATVSRAAGGGLTLGSGGALVVGPIKLVTPQGASLEPLTNTTSYVVNAAPQGTRVGVLAGRLNTVTPGLNPVRMQLAPARAIEVVGAGGAAGGTVSFRPIAMNLVQQPPPNSAMPQVVVTSQSH
jgi:hypothetical protein